MFEMPSLNMGNRRGWSGRSVARSRNERYYGRNTACQAGLY